MFRSITISDNLQLSAKCKIPYLPIIGISIIEFLVVSTFLCYGVYYSFFVRNGLSDFHGGFWTPVVFAGSWSITDPWSRSLCEYYEEKREEVHRFLITISILIHSVCLILSSTSAPNFTCQIIFYGIGGGICTSLITTQVKAVTSGYFENDPKIFEAVRQVSRALSLLLMPHIILFLTDEYDIFAAQFIMSAIILNVIPACLVMKPKRLEAPTKLGRYQTFSGLSIPLQDMSIKENPVDDDSSSDEEDIFSLEDNIDEYKNYQYETPEGSIQTIGDSIRAYFKNIGVNILPQIPEEDEEDNKSIDVISSKRLSRISMKLEEINENNKREGIRAMMTSSERLTPNMFHQSQTSINSGSVQNSVSNDNNSLNVSSFLKEMKSVHRTRCCCTPYRKYMIKRKMRTVKDFILDNFFKPLWFSLKEIQFYVAFVSKASLSITSTIILTIIPFVQIDIHVNAKSSMTSKDGSSLLSIIAFAWCFFLVGTPVIIKWSNVQNKVAFVIGLSICSFSTFVMAHNMATDLITLMCLLYGFGYGIISYTEEIIYRNLLGVRKWRKVQGTLETLTGTFVIILYYFIYINQLYSYYLFVSALIVYSSNAVLWTVTPLLKLLIMNVAKNCNRNKDILY